MTSRSSRAPKRQKLEEEPAAGSYNYNYAAAGYSFPGYVGYQWPAQQASPYALPAAYSYAATYGYGSAYYAAAAAAAAVQAGAGEETETESAVGKKGDYENLLQEMKAKQAARAAGDSQQEVQDKKRFRLPSDGSADQFGRLGRAVSTSLRAAEGASLSLQQLCEDKRIHQEWKELEKSGLVKPNSQLKTFLLERATSFEVSSSPSDQAMVKLIGEAAAPALGEVPAIDAYLRKAGGSERVSRLSVLFGVDEAGLARHFCIYEENGRKYASPGKAPNSAPQIGSKTPLDKTDTATVVSESSVVDRERELKELENHLAGLTRARWHIAKAMIYCLDCAESAPMLSRALAKSLEEPELTIDAGLARIFLISDILHNSVLSSSRGATRYRSTLQELLPGACEQFGFWLRGKGRQSLRQSRSEAAVRQVLDCWRDWSIFPPLFPAGLEALLFAEITEDTDAKAKNDQDPELQAKLAHWQDPGTAPRAPYAARLRGLANSTLPVAACVLRLCHFERFWHSADPARRQRAGIRSPGEGEKACVQKEWDGESLSEDDQVDADGESFSEAVQAAWPVLGLTEWPLGIGDRKSVV